MKQIRYVKAEGRTSDDMWTRVRKTPLIELGDCILVWVNEGDFWINSPIDVSVGEETMDSEKETTRAGIIGLAESAFEKRERVRVLEAMNTPVEYEARKKAMVELELARHEANQAEAALRSLNPYQNVPFR